MSRVLSILLMSAMAVVAAAGDFTGYWKGNVATLPVFFSITETDGIFSATLDSPQQGAKDIPCGDVVVNGDSIKIDMPALSARYAGLMRDNVVYGMFTQHGASLSLNLSRTTKDAAALNRPQEPKPPFLYKMEEVKFGHDSVLLAGTLTTPMWGSRHRAVVLVSGSGTQNRDEEIAGHKPFAVIADYLTRSGFAVLRYDDRGAGGSSPLSEDVTTMEFVTDALSAVDFLKTRNDIDASEIGILGHSEGGTIGFICASMRPDDVAFVVSLAGMAVKGKDLMIRQNEMVAELSGQPLIGSWREDLEELFATIDTVSDTAVLAEKLRVIMARMGTGNEEQVNRNVEMMIQPWYTAFVRLDPSEYIRTIRCPLLAVNGEWDFQVDAKQNLDAIRRLKPDATVRSYPGLNHLFQEAQSRIRSINYGSIEQTISPEVLGDIARWLVDVSGK